MNVFLNKYAVASGVEYDFYCILDRFVPLGLIRITLSNGGLDLFFAELSVGSQRNEKIILLGIYNMIPDYFQTV